jgi:hypothetical protein
MIAACTFRGVSWLAPVYTTQLYSMESVLKTWAARFEPILDETHLEGFHLSLDMVGIVVTHMEIIG